MGLRICGKSATVTVNQTAARNYGTPNLCCSWNLDGEIGVLPFIYIFFFCLSSLVSVALTPFPWQSSDMKMCESVALKHGSNASKCESESHSTQCNFSQTILLQLFLKVGTSTSQPNKSLRSRSHQKN
jgi:hypothetical protein